MPFQKIVISRWLEELAVNQFGDTNVLHVPNGVDLAQFRAPERAKQKAPTVGILYGAWRTMGFRKPLEFDPIESGDEATPMPTPANHEVKNV